MKDPIVKFLIVAFFLMIGFILTGGWISTAFYGKDSFVVGYSAFFVLLIFISAVVFKSPNRLGCFLGLLFLALVGAAFWWMVGG